MFFDFTESEFNKMYNLYDRGIITKREWEQYCWEWEDLLMRMNKKVLDNLKNLSYNIDS